MDQIVEHSPKIRFFEDGYLHIENLAGRESTEDIRARVLDLTRDQDRVAVKASEIIAQPALMDAFLSDRLLSTLRDLFEEDFVFMPAITIRKNWYEDWHIDAAFHADLGGTEMRPDFVQCALYWQDNLPQQGGGLSVIPGTHLRIRHEGRYLLDANFFNLGMSAEDVPNKAGDYVIWDGRLVHRSTAHGPGAPTRLAMFMTVARASADYERFVTHLEKRAVTDRHLGRAAEADRFRDAAGLSFGNGIADNVMARLKKYGATLIAQK